MRRCWWVLLVVLTVVAGACTTKADLEQGRANERATTTTDSSSSDPTDPDAPDPDDQTPDPDPSPSIPRPIPEDPGGPDPTLPGGPPGAELLAELAGRLAITDGSALVIIDPSGENADLIDEAIGGRLDQPTWSPDGVHLAWSTLQSGEGALNLLEIETGLRNQMPTGNTAPVYLQWTDDASRLASLQNEGEELSLGWSAIDPDSSTVGSRREIDEGIPLYFSWSPDNNTLALHRGSTLVLREEQTTKDLLETDLAFSAPDWVDERTVLAAREGALGLVEVGTGLITEVATLAGPTQFVLSPDGSRVAYLGPAGGTRSVSANQTNLAAPVLRVLDLATGNDVVVTDDLAVAWEWSPDSNRLAFLAPSDFADETLRWYFWQDGGIVGATSQHVPSQVELQTYLPFFAQYAQSHTHWSPLGDAFAFAGTIEDVEGIFVHVLGATPQSVLVADGDYVTWSPEEVVGGGGISPL